MLCAVCCGVWCVLHANTGRSEEERREGQHTVCCSVLCCCVLWCCTLIQSLPLLLSLLLPLSGVVGISKKVHATCKGDTNHDGHDGDLV